MSDKYFIGYHGDVEESELGVNKCRHLRFPVRLVVRYGVGLFINCPSFVLNVKRGCVFIKTDQPLRKGTRIIMQFYISPEVKLLGEYKGEVVWVNTHNQYRPKGMEVVFTDQTQQSMSRLENLLEKEEYLIDCTD